MRFNEKTRILWQSAVFALLLLILCMIFYTSMQGLWLSKNRQLAKTVALAGSLSVNSEALATIDCSDDEGSATHQSIKHYLQKIRDLHPSIRYVYIVRQTDKEGIVSFWIDAEEDPSLLSPFGEEYDTAQSPLMWESFKGDVQVEPAFTTDKWGTWLSGYAPVRNNQGQVIGVLGVDVDANEIRARNQRTLLYTLFLYVSTCVIGVGLLNVTAFRLNSTITTLTSNLDEKETKLTNLAQLDQLTGLYTHTFLQEHLEKSRGDQEWCLAAIDIQGLAMVNEVYGYDAGDRVLQAVAQSLKVSLAGEGVAARTGGDEFMLLLRFPANQVGPWYDLLRSKLTESITQLGIPFYLSVGVACYPHNARIIRDLTQCAQDALRKAQRAGGNRVVVAGAVVNPVAHIQAFGVLLGLVSSVDNKDTYTLIHSEQVSNMSVTVARLMGLTEDECEIVRVAGLLHDVGKIAVPDSMLRKPGKLTPDETELVQQHPVFGSRLIVDIPQSQEISEIVLHHHECWDGQGYPNRLEGLGIPLGARILSVVDSYSAMTTDRPYRTALSHEQAVSQLQQGRATQYDPNVVDAFLELYKGAGN